MARVHVTFVTLTAALLVAACDGPRTPEPAAPSRVPAAARSAADARSRSERGRKLFLAECAGCHGEKGRGDGPGAEGLDPKPRDFVREPFKFRSTVFGDPPRRQDVFASVTNGLPGTGMPAFRFLPEDERWLLVDYVRHLANLEKTPESEAMQLGPETAAGPESVGRGRRVYERLECGKCHGPEGRGDGPSAPTLKDNTGRPTSPRDLTNGVLRRGEDSANIHMRFRTGLSGTPMPAYDSNMTQEEGWDLTHFIQSIMKPRAPLPADPVERGRRVVQEKRCDACHAIEGRGGRVGPSLDVAAKKLRYDWAAQFLADPRAAGKVYPYIPYRMPDLGLTKEEIDGVLALFARVAGRTFPEAPPAPVKVDGSKVAEGQLLYFLKCTECHNMGKVIPTPEAKRQGPDLIDVSRRLRYEFMPEWMVNPQTVDPRAAMVDVNLTPEQVAAVQAFVWKTSVESSR